VNWTGAMDLRGVYVTTSAADPDTTLRAFRHLVDGTEGHARLKELASQYDKFRVHIGEEVSEFAFDGSRSVLNVPRDGAQYMAEGRVGRVPRFFGRSRRLGELFGALRDVF